jgi:RNA polymerase sigma-70 factor (TIGR02960 family)
VTSDLVRQAQSGDEGAFRELTELYRRELHLHCYRLLGSFQDAEDAFQEIMLAAWQGLASFQGRSSIRTWLYRVATNRCLNMRRSAESRGAAQSVMQATELPPPTSRGEVLWIEPYPDALLEPASPDPAPDAWYQSRETISLAFITALQQLPPRQRAVLILREVLGFHAIEVAQMLDSTEESVTSALKRARGTLEARLLRPAHEGPPPPSSAAELALVERFTRAFVSDDIEDLVALLTEDVILNMPPLPLEWQGRAAVRQVLAAVLEPGRKLVATRANRQPAFGLYLPDPHTGVLHAVGLLVLTLDGDRVAAISRFEPASLARFGLPRRLPA